MVVLLATDMHVAVMADGTAQRDLAQCERYRCRTADSTGAAQETVHGALLQMSLVAFSATLQSWALID
jgi:hypothetical protein